MKTEQDPRWAAVVARDPKADTLFVYAVKTTVCIAAPAAPRGCHARKTSSSSTLRRKPRPQAIARVNARPGIRPRLAEHHAHLVAEACRQIEQADAPPSLSTLAAHAGLSPYHFHRVSSKPSPA